MGEWLEEGGKHTALAGAGWSFGFWTSWWYGVEVVMGGLVLRFTFKIDEVGGGVGSMTCTGLCWLTYVELGTSVGAQLSINLHVSIILTSIELSGRFSCHHRMLFQNCFLL